MDPLLKKAIKEDAYANDMSCVGCWAGTAIAWDRADKALLKSMDKEKK